MMFMNDNDDDEEDNIDHDDDDGDAEQPIVHVIGNNIEIKTLKLHLDVRVKYLCFCA